VNAPKEKIIRRAVDGVLLLDKPVGLSSTQAMAAAKRLFRADKGGHTGTLDPFATGMLPICFGEATKFSRFMLDAEKSYRATLKLGEVSSTGDTEGEIIRRRDIDHAMLSRENIDAVLHRFTGPQSQTPPMHSALKQDGVALYKLARQGIDVPRTPRGITIFSISLVSIDAHEMVIDTRVSKGTYIRVLAEDIGEALGCGAHLTGLRRTATAGFTLAHANVCTLAQLESVDESSRDAQLLAPEELCAALPRIVLDAADAKIFCNGGWLPSPEGAKEGNEYSIYDESTRFLGVAETAVSEKHANGRLRLIPARLMATGESK
jgi:tRNA pseudouridine55 synthase